MAAGAKLAAERGFWPDEWRVADLEPEEERLLDVLESGEELCAAVPAMLSGHDVDVPMLIGVTERRLLLLTRTTGDTVVVTDVTRCVHHVDRSAPIPFHGQQIRLDASAEHLARVWSLVDEIGRRG